jgi:UPF0042 nucleotide-binding protein
MNRHTKTLVVVTGVSGSGKTVALGALEDAGYLTVNNLPFALFADFVKHLHNSKTKRAAISFENLANVDLTEFNKVGEQIDKKKWQLRILTLDAKDEALIRRFGETRRKHPLADENHTLAEAIASERTLISAIAELGHNIDTTHLSSHNLRTWVKQWAEVPKESLFLVFESFGFKYGAPIDADLLFDARLLPNPHYESGLTNKTGLEKPVIDFLKQYREVEEFEQHLKQFINHWLPLYERDNRASLTICIGCTGGQHRSVYLVSRLAAYFSGSHAVLVRHRQINLG